MGSKYISELEFEEDPSALLKALGMRTGQFRKLKQNILTRLAARPELDMIVIEFRRNGGMFYGEVRYRDTERYRQARKSRSEANQRANAGRDQDRSEERPTNTNDGIRDGSEDRTGWSLEQLLRRGVAKR